MCRISAASVPSAIPLCKGCDQASSQFLGLPHVPVSRCWHQGIKILRKLLAHTHSPCTHMPTALSSTASHPSVLLTLQETEPAGRLYSLSKAKEMDFDPYCTYKYPKPFCRMNCRYLREELKEELPQPCMITMEVQEGKARGVLESPGQQRQHRAPPVWLCTSLLGLGDSREPLHLGTPLWDPCTLPGTHWCCRTPAPSSCNLRAGCPAGFHGAGGGVCCLKASAASRLNDSTQCRRLRLFFFYHAIKMYIQLCPVSLRKQILSSRNERAVLEPPTEFLYVFCILPVDFRFNRLNPCCDFNYHCLKPLFGETFSYFCAFIKVDCL